MTYLIDTNVLSELKKPKPNARVVDWFAERPASALFLSVLTMGELRKGIESLPMGRRQTALLEWLDNDLQTYFQGRILPVDSGVADRWGRLCAQAKRPLPAIDSLLAATALAHDLIVVTRNATDFDVPGLRLIDTWAI